MILVVLLVTVPSFTAGVTVLVSRIFDRFGPAVREDLEWKALRGAQELAHAAEIGLALSDHRLVMQAFGDYRRSADVTAIVGIDRNGRVVATHGAADPASLFAGPPSQISTGPGSLRSWAPAIIEGAEVGKIAIVVSTRREVESEVMLRRIALATGAAGLLVLLCGIAFVNHFTRSISERDRRLASHAASLESTVAERTAELGAVNGEMRLLLDNVEQGFLTVDLAGAMSTQRSRAVERWLGVPAPGATFAEYLQPLDPTVADWFNVALEALRDDLLPRDLLLGQFPARLSHGERTFKLEYSPILQPDGLAISRLVVVLSDITGELARERSEQAGRELTRVFQNLATDRHGTSQFFGEAGEIVRRAIVEPDAELQRRLIHTLKGNCAVFGFDAVVDTCHEIETRMQDEGQMTDTDRRQLSAQWERTAQMLRDLTGISQAGVEIAASDLDELFRAVDRRAPPEEIAAIVRGWSHEPVAVRLSRLAKRAEYLARRLAKPGLNVICEASGLRLDPVRWAPFWSAVIHAINNAIDHGIEPPDERRERGKPAAGQLWLTARRQGSELAISIRDDGRGVDWERLRERAAAAGLPHATTAELVDAMFADGISSTSKVTTTSGRGVGLASLREAIRALGGRIEVRSEPGAGATFSFLFVDRPAWTATAAGVADVAIAPRA